MRNAKCGMKPSSFIIHHFILIIHHSSFIVINDEYILKSKRETKSHPHWNSFRDAEAAICLACRSRTPGF